MRRPACARKQSRVGKHRQHARLQRTRFQGPIARFNRGNIERSFDGTHESNEGFDNNCSSESAEVNGQLEIKYIDRIAVGTDMYEAGCACASLDELMDKAARSTSVKQGWWWEGGGISFKHECALDGAARVSAGFLPSAACDVNAEARRVKETRTVLRPFSSGDDNPVYLYLWPGTVAAWAGARGKAPDR